MNGTVIEKVIKAHFVGNTTAGKSSVIQTVRNGKPSITGDTPELLGTEVLEIYKHVSLGSNTSYQVHIERFKSGKIRKANIFPKSPESPKEELEKRISLSCYDAGGHMQYSVFNEYIVTNGSVVAICFDAESYDNDYSACVGPYFDLIFNTGRLVTIILIATHCYEENDTNLETIEKEVMENAELHYDARTKSMEKKKKVNRPIFLPKLFKVSSLNYRGIRDFKEGLLSICLSDDLIPVAANVPTLWNEMHEIMKTEMKNGAIAIEECIQIYETLQSKTVILTFILIFLISIKKFARSA